MNHQPRMHPEDLRALMAASIAGDPNVKGLRWEADTIKCADDLLTQLNRIPMPATVTAAPEPAPADTTALILSDIRCDIAAVTTLIKSAREDIEAATREGARVERERIIDVLINQRDGICAARWSRAMSDLRMVVGASELRRFLEAKNSVSTSAPPQENVEAAKREGARVERERIIKLLDRNGDCKYAVVDFVCNRRIPANAAIFDGELRKILEPK